MRSTAMPLSPKAEGTGFHRVSALDPTGSENPSGGYDLEEHGFTTQNTRMQTLRRAQHVASQIHIDGAERPSNYWYRVTTQSQFWHMYENMAWLVREVSLFATIKYRMPAELFRFGIEWTPKFALKCENCGYECQTILNKCPVCGSLHLRHPDETQKRYFVRPNGKSVLDEANDNGQSLADVCRAYAELQYQDNQAYILCVGGDLVDDDGNLVREYPLEFICYDPMFVRFLYDETGKIGGRYAFIRDDRNSIIDLDTADAETMAKYEGQTLYPACWQIGASPGGTGKYWLYTKEEVFQDHWFSPSLTYGIPHALSIEDDMMALHYIEKHNLLKYKYGYVRKIVILPGFQDEDVEDITMGVQDILAQNTNTIPLICTPPPMQGVAEMKAQVLDLGTESSSDLIQVKDDARERITAHFGASNIFMGDTSTSGGMNNESQQITVFDRALADKEIRVDNMLKWILSWYPQITDWDLTLARPSKAYNARKKRLDAINEAQQMKGLGFKIYYRDGEFWYSDQPIDQELQATQMDQQLSEMKKQQQASEGMQPGDGEGPPEKGTMRREDAEVNQSKDEIEQSQREASNAAEV